MTFDQAEFDVRCEWGERGVALLAPMSDVVIIVDVLSFTTSVEIATGQGAKVFPYSWKDDRAEEFARSVGAEVADRNNPHRYSLSPASLLNLPAGVRLVLPSPNGSTLSLMAGSATALAGCLRNCRAVAGAASKMGRSVAVIPAGERWADGSLRPCFEDWAGAGAIISFLRGTLSPEASAAMAAFESAAGNLFDRIRLCSSGKEKTGRSEEHDLRLATELDVSPCVPILSGGAYVRQS